MAEQSIHGIVFDTQRFSINDGPGIRTTIFFKGCPLKCSWCDNPESQNLSSDLIFFDSLCVKCYRCVKECPTRASEIGLDGSINIDRKRCNGCGACTKVCLYDARLISGKVMNVEELVEVARKDELFYRNSDGGITASGGEPTFQPHFLREFLRLCHRYGFHTTLDTCGYVKWDILKGILEHVDLVYYDLKHMDSTRHKELTGVDNRLILRNARHIAQSGKAIVIRLPLIPGCNDSEKNIKAMGEFLSGMEVVRVDLLPYHQLGVSKYKRLGRQYRLGNTKPCVEDKLQFIKEILKSYRLEVSSA